MDAFIFALTFDKIFTEKQSATTMALFVGAKKVGAPPHSLNDEVYSFYVQDKKPQVKGEVNILIADGDELDLIRTRFTNVPICWRICTWRGEMAAFIFENLIM